MNTLEQSQNELLALIESTERRDHDQEASEALEIVSEAKELKKRLFDMLEHKPAFLKFEEITLGEMFDFVHDEILEDHEREIEDADAINQRLIDELEDQRKSC